MCLEAANLTNLFCPELTTDSRKWSPLDISPWFLTSDSNNCCLKQCPLMYRIWTNICFTKYLLCVLSLAEHNCPWKPKKTKWNSGWHRPKNIREYSGTNTTDFSKVYSRTDPEIAHPLSQGLTNVGKIVLYNFVGIGVPDSPLHCIALPIIGKSRIAKMMLQHVAASYIVWQFWEERGSAVSPILRRVCS